MAQWKLPSFQRLENSTLEQMLCNYSSPESKVVGEWTKGLSEADPSHSSRCHALVESQRS